jgi:hypothetical protein
VLHGVLVVDAVDLGGLEDDVGADLHRAQRRGGVGGEVGVAGARDEDDDAALLEVADRAPADVGLAISDISIAVSTRVGHAEPLERVLQGEPVDHRREHAHVVGAGAVHALGAAP